MKKDLPGQMGLDGSYIRPPDEACAKNVAPLIPPKRPIFQKVKAKRRVWNLTFQRTEMRDGSICNMPIRLNDSMFVEID
jgi:hypothetical protein